MDKWKKSKIKAWESALIIAASAAAVILLLCLTGYLIMNGYLNKVKYDPGVKPLASAISLEPGDHASPDIIAVLFFS